MADPELSIVIEDDDETVHIDPETGTVITDQPDGGKVVQLDAMRPKADDDENEDKWFSNLVEEIDQSRLGMIANELMEAITADDTSRQNHLAIRARGLELLGTELKEPSSGTADSSGAIEGLSSVTNPLLLDSLLRSWANAQAELLPANGPVKIKNDGDETAQIDELAEAYERDWNHWFTTTAAEYYPDTSHMLLWGTCFGGSGFKKVYRCPIRRRPTSESVDEKDLIVSDTTKDLRACSRITHQIPMRPSVMKRMQLIGAYRKVGLTQPTATTNAVDEQVAAIQGTQAQPTRPEDQPYTLWETQCELDLDQFVPAGKFKSEGIPLPYLVTIDKDSREILALRRDWDEDDKECERKRMYVKYPYIPGPGFYGTGLLNILGNAAAAMTAAWREALDAGMLANFPGGLIAKLGGRQNSSDLTVGMAQFKPIETNGMPIGNVVMGMPYRDVTPGLMALMDKITAQAEKVGGAADIPAAEGIANVPVGTMLAQIEQATKVMAAAHKGQHRAQADEIGLLADLFREHPDDFWRTNEVAPADFWNEQKFLQALDNYKLVPSSDPNVPSHIHRVAKALALVQLIEVPAFAPFLNPKEALTRCLSVLREDTLNLLVDPPAPTGQPSPEELKAQAALTTAQTGQQKVQVEAAKAGQDGQIKAAEIAGEQKIADTKLATEQVIHRNDGAREDAANARAHALDVADHGLAQKQHGLAVAQAHHDAGMDVAEHQLNVHQALNPPEPKTAE